MTIKPSDVLEIWINGIFRRDIEQVLSLYDPSAVLIPTFSDRILDSPIKIREYFEKVLARKGLEISLHEKSLHQQFFSPAFCILSGIYTWKFFVEEEKITYEARFSFVLKTDQEAPILHHHSSQIPRAV